MFRAIIVPISGELDYFTVCGIMQTQCYRPAIGRQHLGCNIHQAVTHILLLLKMGKIIARNMLSWLEILMSGYCCI